MNLNCAGFLFIFQDMKINKENQFVGKYYAGNRICCRHKKTVAPERATVFLPAIR
jgi:hypothetical protein